MLDLSTEHQLYAAGIFVLVLWAAFGRGHRAHQVRGRVGKRRRGTPYSWWPFAALAIAVMWALNTAENGVTVTDDETGEPVAEIGGTP